MVFVDSGLKDNDRSINCEVYIINHVNVLMESLNWHENLQITVIYHQSGKPCI
jgi:hypothetical protein